MPPVTSSASSTPGIGWLIFREKSDLAEDLVFYENYLGKTDATFTLNFSTGSSMVLAQYYNFVRFGKAGYRRIMEVMQENAQSLAKDIEGIGKFQIVGAGEETLPLVAFNLAEEHPYDEFDIAFQLAAERGWMVPAYTMPPNAQDVKMMRALVKLNLSRSLVDTLARRHRRGDQDARAEGARERVRAQTGEDQRHPLSGSRDIEPVLRPPPCEAPARRTGRPALTASRRRPARRRSRCAYAPSPWRSS